MKTKAEVFSSGGGTQSCAIAALIIKGRLPKPDFTVIADTGFECQSTWDYLNKVVGPALTSIGVEVHRPHREKYAYRHDGNWNNKGTLLIPVYTNQSGTPGKLSGFCSKWWKQEVRNNFLRREFGIKRAEYKVWIGFSTDESRRFIRMMNGSEFKRGLIRFPLVHDVPMRREQAIQLVRDMGWPEPPRSRCWKCANQQNDEWAEMKANRPKEWEIACQEDERLRLRDPFAFLHKSGKPLRDADLSDAEQGSRPCDSGACFI